MRKETSMKKLCGGLGIWLLIGIWGSAAWGAKIKTIHDEFEGTTKNTMSRTPGALLGCMPIKLFGKNEIILMYMRAQRLKDENGKTTYSLMIECQAKQWFLIKSGESLILLIDGKRLKLSSEGGTSREDAGTVGSTHYETAWYDVKYWDLKKIANANEVKVKVIGKNFSQTACFKKRNFKLFKLFVTEYGLPHLQAPSFETFEK